MEVLRDVLVGPVLPFLKHALSGVTAAAWYGVALIIDGRCGLRNRLNECGAPGCSRFLLDFDKRGRPSRHCNEEHRRLADAEPSRNRSEERRKRALALRLFRCGETIDYVRGRLAGGYVELTREKLESLQRKARRR